MRQHQALSDELLDVPYLVLPERIIAALRAKADERSELVRDLMNEQAERLLVDPFFFEQAVRVADALWERLARGPSWPFAWPADPLICVGGALAFAADLKNQVMEDLLTMDDEALSRLQQATTHGVSYDRMVKEAVRSCWEGGPRGRTVPDAAAI